MDALILLPYSSRYCYVEIVEFMQELSDEELETLNRQVNQVMEHVRVVYK